ncbi:hypothetical protein [Paracoccus sediminicola]|uniref:hypothetical protein n=1 Tax=Paracoccus sediminicola TaxID=3017783 RepID=UPI0022F0D401|nr:hypothetical protein [Paracoccus sediminicola]WBU58808.1 hypothetical protein PAF18_17495 [Paracoccus sediminicola]
MTDTSSPALSDDELRETLDLLSTVLASVSDRVDTQTEVLGRVNKTATEARQAAFSAKTQTDPERYGDLVGQAVDAEISDSLKRLERMGTDLLKVSNRAEAVIAKAGEDQQAVYNAMRRRERKVDRFRARLPWFGLGAVVLAVAMTFGLPRFLAGDGTTCTIMGAEWTRTTDGQEACVFYGE